MSTANRRAQPAAKGSKPAAGAPANAAVARRPTEGTKGDAMLSDTYTESDVLDAKAAGGELDDFEARLNGQHVAPRTGGNAAPSAARVGNNNGAPARKAPPMRPTAAPLKAKGTPALTEEEQERREEIQGVADLPDY